MLVCLLVLLHEFLFFRIMNSLVQQNPFFFPLQASLKGQIRRRMTWLCEGLKDSMGGSRALESLKKYQVCSERLLSGVGWKSEVMRADALEQFQPNAFPSKYVFLTGVKHFASDFKKRKPSETSQGKFGQEVWRRCRERMHGQILLHPSSQEKEFFSLRMLLTLPLPTGISAESRDKQGALLRGFQGEDSKSFSLDTAEMWDCSERRATARAVGKQEGALWQCSGRDGCRGKMENCWGNCRGKVMYKITFKYTQHLNIPSRTVLQI